jgi:hypothetical protein
MDAHVANVERATAILNVSPTGHQYAEQRAQSPAPARRRDG